jgi:hypothetical protein
MGVGASRNQQMASDGRSVFTTATNANAAFRFTVSSMDGKTVTVNIALSDGGVPDVNVWDVKKHLCEQDPEWALPEEQQLFSTSDENQLKNGGSCFSLFCVLCHR